MAAEGRGESTAVLFSGGGGVIFTLGELRGEPFSVRPEPRLQEETESDFEGVVLVKVVWVGAGLPRDVPPLITVVEPELEGGISSKPLSGKPLAETERLANLPPIAAVMGTELSA
jgi:hypothetical protein